MRVLVTGLDGFTGHYVQQALQAEGYDVIGLRSNLNAIDALEKEIKTVQPDSVIHLAAISSVTHANINAFYETNLIGTRNLLNALANYSPNVKAVLLASSANVYGNRSEGVLDESMAVDPVNDYALSKYAMERMARLWVDRLPIIITRPFNYTGVGQAEALVIPKIVAHFKAKKTSIELGNIDVWRDFGDVRGVAQAYQKLITVPAAIGETVNICSGQAHSLREVIESCETMTGHQLEVSVNPDFVRKNEVWRLTGDDKRLLSLINDWQMPNFNDTLQWMLNDGLR